MSLLSSGIIQVVSNGTTRQVSLSELCDAIIEEFDTRETHGNNIKIKALDEIEYEDVKDTDNVVLDNGEDTYRISVESLKILLSQDNKIKLFTEEINAKVAEINKRCTEVEKDVDQRLQNFSSIFSITRNNLNNVIDKVSKLESDNMALKNFTDELSDKLNTLQDNYNSLKLTVDGFDESIRSCNETVESFTDKIQENTTSIDSINRSIKNINESITSIREAMNTSQSSITDSIKNNNTELTTLIDTKYNDLKKQIDYWHHETDDGDHASV